MIRTLSLKIVAITCIISAIISSCTLGFAILMIIGAACSHLEEEVQKLDGVANFTLGIIVCGLFYGLIYFAMKSNDK